ncbi:hypothetical protein [Mucilaginibacter sp.]|jgi:hypothetical protein|uniref:hypothetical protein n=1 Tax=Mucilaginibacter sp. TaxID=1882438 RepID=UPI003561F47F
MNFRLFELAEMLALITSIFCIKWLWKTPYIFFIPYLLMIVVAERMGSYLGKAGRTDLNILMYNCTTIIEFTFFFYLFYVNLINKRLKNIVVCLSLIYLAFSAFNLLYIQKVEIFNSYSMVLGTIFAMLFVFMYFYDLFEKNEPLQLIRNPMFWISIGIFLFYLGDFTFNLMQPYLQENNLKRESRLFRLINNNLIVFEYVCFSIALIICTRNPSTSKQP